MVVEMNQYQRKLVRERQSIIRQSFGMLIVVLLIGLPILGYSCSEPGFIKNLSSFGLMLIVVLNWIVFIGLTGTIASGYTYLKRDKLLDELLEKESWNEKLEKPEPSKKEKKLWKMVLKFAPSQSLPWTIWKVTDKALDVFVSVYLIYIGFLVTACFSLVFIGQWILVYKLRKLAIEYLRTIEPPETDETMDELCEKLFNGE